jgi:predicted AlkP superfamily phosphohydrolase/phosphomutase/Tfp pilus assembly protein PilF
LIAAVAAAFSLHRVRPDERAFRIAHGGGAAERLAPGLRFAMPLMQRVVRLPLDPIVARGEHAVRSREGAEMRAQWSVQASVPDSAVAALCADGTAPIAILGTKAAEALAEWTRDSSGESLVLGEGSGRAGEALRARLEAAGFTAVSVRLGPVEGPAGMREALAARAVRERSVDTGLKVAIIGLDGADWDLIDPLIARGRIPNLARLKARAAWGPMRSMEPMLSPLLWTTVATGKPPGQHGIIDFLVRDTRTGKPVPVSSRARKVKALWNILSDAGRRAGVIAWWATWPAERITGHIVSDRVAYSTFSFTEGLEDVAGATWPQEYFAAIRPRLVTAEAIRDAELRRFADATPEEFRRLATIVAGARSYQAAALDLLAHGQPDLFALYYQGIDEVSHRYAHFMPPKMAMATADEFRRYRGTVEAYYEYQDALLGEVLGRLEPGTMVIVLSDHGFRNGSGRPPNEPPYIEGKPGLWHRRYGIFMMTGPQARPGRLDTTQLLDIAPTVLYLLGLPIGEDMPGRIVEEAVDPRFRARVARRTIPTYEGIGAPAAAADLIADSRVEDEMVARLRSLGYIAGGEGGGGAATGDGEAHGGAVAGTAGAGGDAPGAAGLGGGALITAHVNEASLHLQNKDYRRAEASVEEALRSSPDFLPALILKAQIASEQKRWAEALEIGKRVIALDPEGERQAYAQVARTFIDSGKLEEGIAFMRAAATGHPGIGEIRSALGRLLLKSGDRNGAEKELLAALAINPALGDPLAELYTLYKGTDKVLGLEPVVRQGLALNDQSVVHHNWMGLILEWKHDLAGAEREFARAMDLDPDYAPTMANLGALYGRSNRLKEAVAILERAVVKDADNIEAWVNLGAAQGRLRRPKEAIEALETARRKGARSTTLYNALALAYLQDQRKDKGMEYLRESLEIDPNQKDVRELLATVSRQS